jgi:hypothetical protein
MEGNTMMKQERLYWVKINGEQRPLHYDNGGVAWIARDAFGGYERATAAEVASAKPAAHGHWGQPIH